MLPSLRRTEFCTTSIARPPSSAPIATTTPPKLSLGCVSMAKQKGRHAPSDVIPMQGMHIFLLPQPSSGVWKDERRSSFQDRQTVRRAYFRGARLQPLTDVDHSRFSPFFHTSSTQDEGGGVAQPELGRPQRAPPAASRGGRVPKTSCAMRTKVRPGGVRAYFFVAL